MPACGIPQRDIYGPALGIDPTPPLHRLGDHITILPPYSHREVEIVDRNRARQQSHGYSWCGVAVMALLVLVLLFALFDWPLGFTAQYRLDTSSRGQTVSRNAAASIGSASRPSPSTTPNSR